MKISLQNYGRSADHSQMHAYERKLLWSDFSAITKQPDFRNLKKLKYIMKVLIETQYKEWYGCEDNVGVEGHGRYKNKGGMDFVVNVDEMIFIYEQEAIIEAFNKKYNVKGSWTLCEILDLRYYTEPDDIELDIVTTA